MKVRSKGNKKVKNILLRVPKYTRRIIIINEPIRARVGLWLVSLRAVVLLLSLFVVEVGDDDKMMCGNREECCVVPLRFVGLRVTCVHTIIFTTDEAVSIDEYY